MRAVVFAPLCIYFFVNSFTCFATSLDEAVEKCISEAVKPYMNPTFSQFNMVGNVELSRWSWISGAPSQNVYWYNFDASSNEGKQISGSVRMRVPRRLDLVNPAEVTKVCYVQELSSSYDDAYFILYGSDGSEIFRKANHLRMPYDE